MVVESAVAAETPNAPLLTLRETVNKNTKTRNTFTENTYEHIARLRNRYHGRDTENMQFKYLRGGNIPPGCRSRRQLHNVVCRKEIPSSVPQQLEPGT